MKIKTKLSINIISWVCFFVILVASLMMVKARVNESIQDGNLSDQIMIGASDMSNITYDYLLNPGERTRMQWELKHRSLNDLLNQVKLGTREAIILDRMKKNHQETETLFGELVSTFDVKKPAPPPMQSFIEENRERLTAGLIARSRMIVNDAARLTLEIGSDISDVQSTYLVLILTILGTMALLAVTISYLTGRDIAEAIVTLRRGTESLARGDLSYTVPVRGKDEISELSRDFNEMAAKLKSSRESLEREIVKREKAREEVRKAYSELEERVLERTREITIINEELTKSRNELKATVQDLESFTYSVSHDLRAPLRAIDGFSGMLAKDLADRLDRESKRKLRIVRENTAKMDRLINDLLNLSRLGRRALNPVVLDMEEIFREAWSELCQPTPERDAQLDLHHLQKVTGDRMLIKQVVLNLLSNALKYTRDRHPALVEVRSSEDGGSVVFSVKDNGAGFDMKFSDKLFGIFQRLHSPSEYEGTGVGLAIVQRLIQSHGGRVWAEGEPGKGATFYFSLPR